MPARGLHGLWLRSFAAAAACVLALASTSALVAAAVVSPTGSGPAIVLTSDGNGNGGSLGHGNGDGNGGRGDEGGGTGSSHGDANGFLNGITSWLKLVTPEPVTNQAPKPAKPKTPPPPPVHPPAWHPKPAVRAAPAHPTAPPAAPALAQVVVDSSDPAPFSAEAVAATDAARVLPVERLGPLSGISFGSGLFIWPLLLAVDVLALAVVARMAIRRRLASPED